MLEDIIAGAFVKTLPEGKNQLGGWDFFAGLPAGLAPPMLSMGPRALSLLTLSECLFFFGIYTFYFGRPRRLFSLQFLKAAMPHFPNLPRY